MLCFKIFLKNNKNSSSFFPKRNFFWKAKIKMASNFFKNREFELYSRNKLKNLTKKKKNSNKIFFPFGDWIWELSVGIFFLFFGFFSATSAITIIGSVADWDPLAAAVMLCWIELFTKIFYATEKSTLYFRLINSFKIGINLGMFVDAFKITG
ncbi:hypothetical protein CMESO_344 (nucleomorph) [Chroomonas mesostigmatica CCMP1168]|uniref:DUF565 domain-containing protein n=1 Tax=Chroomonas mesostigmatica CCMP1168 TaxID=1195612 RepID=J7G621_9CRYP|nr:hypothetical protein CMESO_344 [Chroomonas mesostigmatica CCMP1168]|mmetsp:Transcript_16600/g.40554  ORF Transcript_16600/g.40554 Transcript_16600/m.40554 type:complete len:153 (-) Transcript_16600:2637-3095(-)